MKKLISLLLMLSMLLTMLLASCSDKPDGSADDDQLSSDQTPTDEIVEGENDTTEEDTTEDNKTEEDNAEDDQIDYESLFNNSLEDSLYGVFKRFANDNHYESFTKDLNSAHTTAETQETLRQLHDRFGHYAQLQIHKGICYVAFMHGGQGGDAYYQDDYGVTLATFELQRALSSDFNYITDVTLHKIVNIGDKFADNTLLSASNSPSMIISGDKIFITLVFDSKEQGQWGVFATVFDTNKNKFVDEYQMELKYKNKVTPLNNDSINHVYTREGCQTTPNYMILASADWSKQGKYYYSTIIVDTYANNGFIVRTTDFRTLEFVSIVKGNDNGQCEVATYVFNDKVYVACRQPWTTPYLLFMRYDIKTGEWTDPYKIEDGNSRAWIFEYNNEIYLFNTIEEPGTGWRRYANISKIRTDTVAHTGRCAPVDVVATLFECGDHHSYFIYDGKIYFTATIGSRIHFGELKLKQYSTEKVNNRLIELFGDLE